MRVSPIYSTNIKNQYASSKAQNCSFSSSYRAVEDLSGKLKYRTSTSFFREDIEWYDLANLLGEKYKNTDKVNIVDYACSSGEEAYTIVLSLIKQLGKKTASKFFPIVAKDIDEENIRMAKSGYLIANEKEKKFLDDSSGFFPRPFNIHSINSYHKRQSYIYRNKAKYLIEFDRDLRKNIKFSVADINEDINSLPQKDTVLFCRNMWPYLPSQNQIKLLDIIMEKIHNTNSLIVLGDYDMYGSPFDLNYKNFTSALKMLHLKETKVENVFEI